MYGIYLPTFTIKKIKMHIGKCARAMDTIMKVKVTPPTWGRQLGCSVNLDPWLGYDCSILHSLGPNIIAAKKWWLETTFLLVTGDCKQQIHCVYNIPKYYMPTTCITYIPLLLVGPGAIFAGPSFLRTCNFLSWTWPRRPLTIISKVASPSFTQRYIVGIQRFDNPSILDYKNPKPSYTHFKHTKPCHIFTKKFFAGLILVFHDGKNWCILSSKASMIQINITRYNHGKKWFPNMSVIDVQKSQGFFVWHILPTLWFLEDSKGF